MRMAKHVTPAYSNDAPEGLQKFHIVLIFWPVLGDLLLPYVRYSTFLAWNERPVPLFLRCATHHSRG
jgi:hypothetical protein